MSEDQNPTTDQALLLGDGNYWYLIGRQDAYFKACRIIEENRGMEANDLLRQVMITLRKYAELPCGHDDDDDDED
jgi:hypothetical protein